VTSHLSAPVTDNHVSVETMDNLSGDATYCILNVFPLLTRYYAFYHSVVVLVFQDYNATIY
jgi:hypothetical protein